MGAGQSHSGAAGGGPGSRASTATKTSYYELLDIDRSATEDEIKKAYRRKALTLHPDRNYGDVERVTALFTEVQSAYEVLSDAQERAWYDAHEDAILSGYDPADNPDPGADDGDDYEHTAGLTSADDIVRVMGRFNRNVEFSDAAAGFYGFLGGVFGKLAQEEMVVARREGVDGMVYPGFGRKEDGHEDVVRGFYGVWAGFSTRKTFAWRDRYRPSDAPDRRTRRYIEKENQTARNEGIREFNDAVRSLVAFVRKRDPRFIANQQSEEEREKALREATAARAAKQRAENTKKMEAEVLPEWAKHREPDEVIEEDDEESEEEQFECVACRKTFKSENQFEAHEKSKKHVKAVQALRRKMQKEGVSLDLSEDEEGGVLDDGDYPIMEHVEEHENHYPIMDDSRAQGDDASEEDLGHDEELDMDGEGGSDEELDIATKELHLNRQAGSDDNAPQDVPTSDGNSHHFATAKTPPDTKDDIEEQESDTEQDDGSSSDDEAKSSTIPSLSTSPQQKSAPEPKLGKAAQKRAKKAAQAAATEESDLQHRCASCQAAFPSKTRLFQHIKDHPGHAAPVDSGKKSKGGGGKSKKR